MTTLELPRLEGASRIYAKNLNALRIHQPAVVEIIETAEPPVEVAPAVGRDGTPTLRIKAGDDRWVWFGETSMPSISAAECFGGADGSAGNVSLPGVGSGHEIRTILERLPPYRALFVIEEDAVPLRLALQVLDFSDAIALGKLVFLPGGDWVRHMVDYFERAPGCEMPARMFTLASRGASEIAELRRRLELTGERVLSGQSRVAAKLAAAIAAGPSAPLPRSPKTAVLSTEPSLETGEAVRRLLRATGGLGWSAAGCVPDRPDRCHIVARMSVINEVRADWILTVNSVPGSLRTLLPPDRPIVTWLTIGGCVPEAVGVAPGGCDLFLVSTQEQFDRLVQGGVPREAIRFAGPMLDRPPGAEVTAKSNAAAIVLNLYDARAAACGINLPSHIALWEALDAAYKSVVETDSAKPVEELFHRAEQLCGVALQEPKVRAQFLALFEERMRPVLQAAAIVAQLRRGRRAVEVWGGGWSALPGGGISSRGPIPETEELTRILTSAAVLILPNISASAVRIGLEAFAVGTPVVVLGDARSFRAAFPGLAPISDRMKFVSRLSDLTATVDAARFSDADARLDSACTIEDQLLQLHDEVARLQTRGGTP